MVNQHQDCAVVQRHGSKQPSQGPREEQILTGLAPAGVLAGQLAGSPLRQRLVVATVGLAIEISVLGVRRQALTVSGFPGNSTKMRSHLPH